MCSHFRDAGCWWCYWWSVWCTTRDVSQDGNFSFGECKVWTYSEVETVCGCIENHATNPSSKFCCKQFCICNAGSLWWLARGQLWDSNEPYCWFESPCFLWRDLMVGLQRSRLLLLMIGWLQTMWRSSLLYLKILSGWNSLHNDCVRRQMSRTTKSSSRTKIPISRTRLQYDI